MSPWKVCLCLVFVAAAAFWLGRQSVERPSSVDLNAQRLLSATPELAAGGHLQISRGEREPITLENADGDSPAGTPTIKVASESRSSSLPTPMDPLQAGASGAVPHVGALLSDSKFNPKRLRLSAANRAELQKTIDDANRAHAALRADLSKEMRVYARAVIEAGGGEAIVPGVPARAPKGMTMVSISDKALGYYHRVFFELGSVPQLAAINDQSKLVIANALQTAAQFLDSHGVP